MVVMQTKSIYQHQAAIYLQLILISRNATDITRKNNILQRIFIFVLFSDCLWRFEVSGWMDILWFNFNKIF